MNHELQRDIFALKLMPRELLTLSSSDTIKADTEESLVNQNVLYSTDYLSSITLANLPPHNLFLKKNAPLLLLRTINPAAGLCNGTR